MKFDDNRVPIAFGMVLKRLREEKGLSQREFAVKSRTHQSYISILEQGQRNITWDMLTKLSQALDLQMSQLVLLVENEVRMDDMGSSEHHE